MGGDVQYHTNSVKILDYEFLGSKVYEFIRNAPFIAYYLLLFVDEYLIFDDKLLETSYCLCIIYSGTYQLCSLHCSHSQRLMPEGVKKGINLNQTLKYFSAFAL